MYVLKKSEDSAEFFTAKRETDMARLWGKELADYLRELRKKESGSPPPVSRHTDHPVGSDHNYDMASIGKLAPSTIAAIARAARKA
jgi:hypothetical protein